MITGKNELTDVPIGDLIPYERNPRKNDKAVKKVAASLEQFGLVKNSVVVDEDMVLLAGRWPPEVDAESGPRVSAAIFGRVWDTLCNATPADELEDIATCGLSGVNEEQMENEVLEEAPVVIHIHATPVNHVDGWSWSHVVTEIRAIGI